MRKVLSHSPQNIKANYVQNDLTIVISVLVFSVVIIVMALFVERLGGNIVQV